MTTAQRLSTEHERAAHAYTAELLLGKFGADYQAALREYNRTSAALIEYRRTNRS